MFNTPIEIIYQMKHFQTEHPVNLLSYLIIHCCPLVANLPCCIIDFQDIVDVWESEESVSEDSDEEEEEDSDENAEETAKKENIESIKTEKDLTSTTVPKGSKALKKSKACSNSAEQNNSLPADMEEELEVSSFGRIRKRRIIPNNIEDPPLPKKKKAVPPSSEQEKEHSPSPTPNILQGSKQRPLSVVTPVPITQARTMLSQEKPGSSPRLPLTLPPGMQLLTVSDGRTLLLNTCTNPPVILQTSAPLNLNNLNLLAQLSSQAAGGTTSTPMSGATPLQPAQAIPKVTSPVTVESTGSNSQQLIKALLSATSTGHQLSTPQTSQFPRAGGDVRIQPVTPTGSVQHVALVSPPASTTVVSSTPVQSALLQTLTSGTVGTQVRVTSMAGSTASSLSRVITTQQSVLNNHQGNPPPYYKYNDVSQMRASIKQQLVKSGNWPRGRLPAVRPQGYAASTALNNLIQAGLMPQMPKVASTTAASIIKGHQTQSQTSTSVSQIITTSPTTVQPATTSVGTANSTKPSVISASLADLAHVTGSPNMVQGAANISVLKTVSPTPQRSVLEGQSTPIPAKSVIVTPHTSPDASVGVLSYTSPVSPSVSPTTVSHPGSAFTSPHKSPVHSTNVLSTANLSPELLAKLQSPGLTSETSMSGLVSSSAGILKALGSPTRPKYASNVTVKSLLESRAARQKAQGEVEKQLFTSENGCEASSSSPVSFGPPSIQASVGKSPVQLQTVRTLQGSILSVPPVQLRSQVSHDTLW